MNGNNKVHDQKHTNGTPTVVFSSGDEDNGEVSKEQNGASAIPQNQSHLSRELLILITYFTYLH